MRLFLCFFSLACSSTPKTILEEEEQIETLSDIDGDGFFSDEDCDDGDANIYPNATESILFYTPKIHKERVNLKSNRQRFSCVPKSGQVNETIGTVTFH